MSMTTEEALEALAEDLRERESEHSNPGWGPADDYAECPGDTCHICQLWDAHAVLSELARRTRKKEAK